ncbi:zinc finger protein 83-like [Leptidea sinapis]|uniref:zinc finger protein 83-like n=1 Tax=Leptidea sinapis TaxID=189913 RepID=UPI0021360A78|nr:zinc finger protein 83-like [Leptidea sinapis]
MDEQDHKLICRCCLSTERRMKKIDNFRYLFVDFADIIITDTDGLPQWICWECEAIIHKSVRFKHKMLKVNAILYDYVKRCAPFAIDSQDVELKGCSISTLSMTNTLILDSKNKNGVPEVVEHQKLKTTSDDMKLFEAPKNDADVSIKNEDTYDDDYGQDSFDDRGALLEEIKTELIEDVKKECKKRERVKDLDQTEKRKVKRRGKAPSKDLDESKIRIIRLDPAAQLKQREEDTKDDLKLPYHCHLCFKGFIFEEKLNNHMKKHSPSRGTFKCDICSMYLPTKYSLSVHMLTHTQRYECVSCGRRMLDRSSILNHYRVEHEGITSLYTCHICGKIVSNPKTLRGHIRNIHTGTRTRCEQCGKTFVNKDALAEHMLIHKGVKDHSCPVCAKKFRTRQQVVHHQVKHTDNKNFYCVECDVRFKTTSALRQHLRRSTRHRDVDSLLFQCDSCPKRFESAAQLSQHRGVQHEGSRPYPCPQCACALATRSSLAKHMRAVHGGQRPPPVHVCDTCGKVFRAKSTLVNHVRTHTGEKPFSCSECGRRFTQRTAMRTHVKLVHLKMHRSAKLKPKLPAEVTKAEPFKDDVTLVFEWNKQMQTCEYFTVTAGP